MIQETIYELFIKVLQQIVTDIITLLPKIFLTIVVLVIATLAIRLLNGVFGRMLKLVKLDSMFKTLVKVELPFSISNLVILLIDIGIILITIFGLANIFLEPVQMEFIMEVLGYGMRILSVIAVTILTFFLFNMLIGKVTIETRMRGYIMFILLILITMMIFDLTNLSELTQMELQKGLSLGLGIAIGVFAIWFFFHDYLDKLLGLKPASSGSRRRRT